METVYFHIDLDAFFASVEQLDHPEYRGKPVIVGGLPGDRRAVVSTASYEARKYGVHSAMPIAQAVQLCPKGIYLRGNHRRYQEKSSEVMDIFSNYSPDVTQISIDEAFLDMTGTERLFGPPAELALKIKKEILNRTGLTVSIGIGPTMYIAKIASGLNKPDGLTIISAGDESKFMVSLPLEKLWGCGTKTLEHIKRAGFRTTADIYVKPVEYLVTIFGEGTGRFLYNAVRGNKDLVFGAEAKNRSVSSETTYDFDLYDTYAIETAIMALAENVIFRLHKENVRSRTVAVKIRYEDFTTCSIQSTSDFPVANADDLFERCVSLFKKKYEHGRGIRLLGISCENVEDKSVPVQQDLFDFGNTKKSKVEKAIFSMEEKNPQLKIHKARLLIDPYSRGAK